MGIFDRMKEHSMREMQGETLPEHYDLPTPPQPHADINTLLSRIVHQNEIIIDLLKSIDDHLYRIERRGLNEIR